MVNRKRYRFRVVVPGFPFFNVYTDIAKVTTSLGPICVATAASKLDLWDVEVIDENNCRDGHCPRDSEGRPDHRALQEVRPADVVGFYGSLSSTIPRLFELIPGGVEKTGNIKRVPLLVVKFGTNNTDCTGSSCA